MPANLPPQYYQAEKNYRLAKTPQEKIEALEAMLSVMPHHKGTDKLRAELRRKIAKLSEEPQKQSIRRGDSYYIKKEGAGQAILIGPPNVGKSQIVLAITDAIPEVADYPFTTKTLIPAMMKFENIQIQLVDTPPMIAQSTPPWLGNLLRNADFLLIIIDLSSEPVAQVEAIIEELRKLRIAPEGKALIVGNKNDLDSSGESFQRLSQRYGEQFPIVSISAQSGAGLEGLRGKVYQMLGIIRVYTKAPGAKPDFTEPIILKKGSTVEDVAESIHKHFRSQLKYALIWGSGKFNGQRVHRKHILDEGDVLELHA